MRDVGDVADDEGDGEAERLRRAGRRRRRLRRRRAGLPDAARTSTAAAHAAHRRATSRSTRRTPASPSCSEAICDRYRADYGVELRAPTRSSSRRAASRRSTTRRWRSSARATRSSRTRRAGRRSPSRSSWPTRRRSSCGRTPEDGFALHGRARSSTAITPRTRGIIINSPCNPTGALIAEARWPRSLARRGAARHLDRRRSLLRAADLRPGAAQPAGGASRAHCATGSCSAARRRRRTR